MSAVRPAMADRTADIPPLAVGFQQDLFYICSIVDSYAEFAMVYPFHWATLVWAMLGATDPVFASTGDVDGNTVNQTLERPGYKLERASGGFSLITHGVWIAAPVAARRSMAGARTSLQSRQGQVTGFRSHPPSGFRRAAYLARVTAAEVRFALPPGLLDALIWTESRYNPRAISKAGAVGLGQLMPRTARALGVSNRFDVADNVTGAALYLRQMLDKFGVVHLALAAYNAGPAAVQRAGGIPPNGETPLYVRDVMRAWRF